MWIPGQGHNSNFVWNFPPPHHRSTLHSHCTELTNCGPSSENILNTCHLTPFAVHWHLTRSIFHKRECAFSWIGFQCFADAIIVELKWTVSVSSLEPKELLVESLAHQMSAFSDAGTNLQRFQDFHLFEGILGPPTKIMDLLSGVTSFCKAKHCHILLLRCQHQSSTGQRGIFGTQREETESSGCGVVSHNVCMSLCDTFASGVACCQCDQQHSMI